MRTIKIIIIFILSFFLLTTGLESAFACDPVYSLPRYNAPEINIKEGDIVGINAYSRAPNATKLYKGMLILFKTSPHKNGVFLVKVKDLKTGINLQQWSTASNKATYEEIGEYGSYQLIVTEANTNGICFPSNPITFTTGPANPLEIKSPSSYCPGGITTISWINCLKGSTYNVFLYEKGKSKEIFSTTGTTASNTLNEITATLPVLSATKTYFLKITEKLGTTHYNKTKSPYYFSGGTLSTLSFKARTSLVLTQVNKKITLSWDSYLPLSEGNKAKIEVYKENAAANILYTLDIPAKSTVSLDLKNVLDDQYDGKYVVAFSFMGKQESIKFDYASVAASLPIVTSSILSPTVIKQVTLTFADNRFANQGYLLKIIDPSGKLVKTTSFRPSPAKNNLVLYLTTGNKAEITIKSSYYSSSKAIKLITTLQF